MKRALAAHKPDGGVYLRKGAVVVWEPECDSGVQEIKNSISEAIRKAGLHYVFCFDSVYIRPADFPKWRETLTKMKHSQWLRAIELMEADDGVCLEVQWG